MSYEAAGGSLKLKGVIDKKIKKKKSKSKNETTEKQKTKLLVGESELPVKQILMTKAEEAFERRSAKRIEDKIVTQAERSHKERVESYNRHLDSLTEYNDIPKVSWTK